MTARPLGVDVPTLKAFYAGLGAEQRVRIWSRSVEVALESVSDKALHPGVSSKPVDDSTPPYADVPKPVAPDLSNDVGKISNPIAAKGRVRRFADHTDDVFALLSPRARERVEMLRKGDLTVQGDKRSKRRPAEG